MYGIKGEEPGIFIIVGESVSATYCGPESSRLEDRRAADEDEGYCRWCLLARLELFDNDEAVESRLDAPRRCGARGMLPMPDKSPVMPTTLPISVDVRSIDITPGAADDRRSDVPGPCGYLPVARLVVEKLDARELRPLPFGSLFVSIVAGEHRVTLMAMPRVLFAVLGKDVSVIGMGPKREDAACGACAAADAQVRETSDGYTILVKLSSKKKTSVEERRMGWEEAEEMKVRHEYVCASLWSYLLFRWSKAASPIRVSNR